MIVIRKNAPGINIGRELLACLQQCAFTLSHSFRRDADYVPVLVTGTGDHELQESCEFPMRRRVPGTLPQTTIFDGFSSLLDRHFAIVVHKQSNSGLTAYRVPTLVGLSLANKSPTQVGTLYTVSSYHYDPTSQHNPRVTLSPGNSLAVEIFQQGNRVLARDAGQVLESCDVDRSVLRAVRTNLLS